MREFRFRPDGDNEKKVNPNFIPPASVKNDKLVEKQVAREILSMIEQVCFSDEYLEYRCNYGSNGQRDLIIKLIKQKYNVG